MYTHTSYLGLQSAPERPDVACGGQAAVVAGVVEDQGGLGRHRLPEQNGFISHHHITPYHITSSHRTT